MGKSDGRPRGRPRRAVGLLLAVTVVTVVVVVLGVVAVRSGGGSESSDGGGAAPAATPTSLADVDTETLAVSRAAFCEDVTAAEVQDALAAAPTDAQAYGDGDRVRLVRGTQDVSHEYGCLWKAGKTIARGWVFAPPVTTARARQLVREARRVGQEQDCERMRDAPAYGVRSVALLCPTTRGSEVSYRGLYGDAWLTCTLSAPDTVATDELLDRADSFCAAVAQAAA